jgi:hypothetical protein
VQLTIQTRPLLSPSAVETLDRLTSHYGVLLHKLYAEVAAGGGKAKDYKTGFCAKYNVTARIFNGLANDLQGTLDSTCELLKERVKDLRNEIYSAQRSLKDFDKKFAKLAARQMAVSATTFEKWARRCAKLKRKITRSEHKLDGFAARLAAKVPGIGFGSRKLFKKQYQLEANGYASHEAWLADWRAARAHQCFYLGSGDETGGNQSCTLSTSSAEGVNTLSLRIRLPDAIRAVGENKYLMLEGLSFPCAGAARCPCARPGLDLAHSPGPQGIPADGRVRAAGGGGVDACGPLRCHRRRF